MKLKHIRNGVAFGIIAVTIGASAWPVGDDGQEFEAPEPGSYVLPIVKKAADGEVLNAKGEALRLREFTHGRVTVMSFIYTRCAAAKACPMATGVLLQLRRASAEDRALAKNLRLVSMSFDPGADTPQRMADYADVMRGRNSGAEWHFLTTRSPAQLQPILEAYGQAVDRKANPADPTGPLNHTLRVFLIDRAGNIRNIYSSGTLDVRLVLADVRTLLLETTPAERASAGGRIPASAPKAFDASDLDELARRFESRNVLVTGKVEVEPHPLRHDAAGGNQPPPTMTIADAGQIRIVSVPVLAQKQIDLNPTIINP